MTAPSNHQRLESLLTKDIYELAWRHAWRLSATREDAEDLLQSALALAIARLSQLRDDGSFKTWLLAIVRNLGISALRSKRRRQEAEASEQRLDATGHISSAGAASTPFVDPRAELLSRGLCALPAEQRALLEMHYMDGLEAREIAQVFGVSGGSVEQRLHRARAALRKAIRRLEGPAKHSSQGRDTADCEG